eukprot:2576292-Prymnesium_polylepis.1
MCRASPSPSRAADLAAARLSSSTFGSGRTTACSTCRWSCASVARCVRSRRRLSWTCRARSQPHGRSSATSARR